MTILKQDLEAHYRERYNNEIKFSDLRFVKTGGIFHRKHFAVASFRVSEMRPETESEASHQYSRSDYYVVPIIKKSLGKDGVLYVMTSLDAHNRYVYNEEGRKETWRTSEVSVEIKSGDTELAQIRSSGTGDTPYIDATDNIKVKPWFERALPVYDFVIETGLSEQDKMILTDNDIRKRKSIVYKFALEFFKTFVLSKEEIKAEQKRLKDILREEAEAKRRERIKAREIARAEKKAYAAQKAAAKVRVQMDDKASSAKKKLMKDFLGNDIFD